MHTGKKLPNNLTLSLALFIIKIYVLNIAPSCYSAKAKIFLQGTSDNWAANNS